MPVLRLRTVRQKLLLMVLIANCCTLIAAGGALFYHDLKESRVEMAAGLTAVAGVLGQGSAAALEFDDPKVAKENLALLRANPNIVAAAIYTAKGTLFARYGAEQGLGSNIPMLPLRDGFRFEGSELTVFRRITTNRDVVGAVYLKERYDLPKWLGDYLLVLGAVLLASLALGLLISSRMQRWISDPIQKVSAVAREVMERRDYNLRAAKTTEDEIGHLADAFNGMLQTLQHEIAERSAAEQAVRSLNTELEQRVAERTSELRVANQKLVVRTDEAEAANRAKASFLANMSHEIRTPMNAILGLAYLLDQRHLEGDSSDLVKKIRNAGRSLQAIINDILDFSKIEAGRLEIEHAPFRLVDVLDNLAGIMAANGGDKDLELVIAPPPDIGGQLLGDALRLEQVLINLTGNAIKFTDSGLVKVEIGLLSRDEKCATLRFAVTDTGIGIPQEKQTQIFASFAQADVSTTRRFGGTGLGLTICQHLVSKMGGEIGVISTPGRGSEFWFTIPFEWREAAEFTPVELARLNVLVVDDNVIARENLTAMARSLGWNANQAESGEAAICKVCEKQAAHESYDLLLVDWKMPGMDGLAAAVELRRILGDEPLPVVLMVTAFSRDELLRHPGIGVVDGVLSKPVTSSSLYNGVAEALRRRGRAGGLAAVTKRVGRRIPGLRVLIVDDSDINREVAYRILAAEGATVESANNGKAALDWLQANHGAVDIVLMDVQMPVMDGYEATRQMRATPQLADLPVVALTAGAFKAQQEAAQQAGMNAFVAKPFDVDELLTTIQRLTHCSPELVAAGADESAAPVPPADASLPGIDLAKGLAVWGEWAVYRKFLLKFADDYADCPALLATCVADHLPDTAKAILHKLKGASGNLALSGVAALAADAETQLDCGGDVESALQRLQAEFATVFASIASLAAGAAVPAASASANADDVEAVAPLMLEMLRALDTDTPDRANELLRELSKRLPPDSLAALQAHIDDFDFRAAETATRRLAADLGIVLEE